MKDLELTVYPLDPSFPRGYKLPRDTRITFVAANRMAKAKHLTSTELAAEWWKSVATAPVLHESGRTAFAKREIGIAKILECFATHPHASERNYQ